MNLDELERTLLDAARNELGPSEVDRERHHVELLARMAGAPAWQAHLRWPEGAQNDAGRAPFSSGVVARLPAASRWARLKLLCVGLVMGAVLGGLLGFGLGRGARSAAAPRSEPSMQSASGGVSRPSSSARAVKAALPIQSVVSEPEAPSADERRVERSVSADRTRPPRRAHAKDARRPGAAGQPESSLAVELAMLQRARRALNAQNGRLALGIVQELDERFPKGLLVEERSATRILSLCMLERAAEARRFAGHFLERHPGSVYAERVRQSCVADQPE